MTKKYVKAWNGIRAIAMLGVLFYHVFPRQVPGGYLGVVTFFVMAGFLGLLTLKRAFYGASSEQAFRILLRDAAKRLKRLLPELLWMVFWCLVWMLVSFPTAIKPNTVSVFGTVSFTNNITQIFEGQSYFDQVGMLKPFTHLWALSMEFQFHLMLGLLFGILYRSKKRKAPGPVLLGISVASFLYMKVLYGTGADMTRVYYDTFGRFFSYSVGAMLALFAARGTKLRSVPGIAAALLLFSVGSFFVFGISDLVFRVVFLLYSIAAAALLYIVYRSDSAVTRFLEQRPLQWLGERSFSIYLWHYPILKFTEKIFAHADIPDLVFYGLFFIFTASVSELSYRLFARNGDALKAVNTLPARAKYAGVALLLFCVLGISAVSAFAGGSSELDRMKRTILENEERMAQKSEAGTGERGPMPSTLAPAETSDPVETPDSSGTPVSTGTSASTGTPGSTGTPASTGALGSEETPASTEASSAESVETTTEPAAPAEKSAAHRKADSFVGYVNAFGEKVYLDVDRYGKYRLTKLLIIGDSIVSMSYHTLQLYMPEAIIDGLHNREFGGAYEVYRKYLAETGGEIGDFVVLALGSNGDVRKEDIDKVREELSGRKLLLVSIVLPYKNVEETRNAEIDAYAEAHEDVYLVDWHAAAKNQEQWFFEDNIHPGENGAKVYSQLIIKKVIEILEGIETP